MRSDMPKLLVERPRSGRWQKNGTVRSHRRAVTAGEWEHLPKTSGMKPRHGGRRSLNENLKPLIRFLQRRVGQPWDRVYSELRAQLDVRSAVQLHIMEHLDDFVALQVERRHGGVYRVAGSTWRTGRLWRDGKTFFVDPRDGVLRQPRHARPRRGSAPHETIAGERLARFQSVWYAVETRPGRAVGRVRWRTVYDYGDAWDVVLKKAPGPDDEFDRYRLYGVHHHYAVSKRQLGKRELKRYGLWRR